MNQHHQTAFPSRVDSLAEQQNRYISQLYVVPAVDAVDAGKGQLEISVNQGQVPNNVQLQDAGRCLVTFIPQYAGTYMIDVTFNGKQVHGCPIKVDVHHKSVGKPVSAPVYAPYTGTQSQQQSQQVSPDRGPSSAYFSASPQIDTTYSSYAPTPASLSRYAESPSSPHQIGHVIEQRGSGDQQFRAVYVPASTSSDLKSPALVKSTLESNGYQSKGLLGYTVAQYGSLDGTSPTKYSSAQHPQQHKYFGDDQLPTTQRYFEKTDAQKDTSEWRGLSPESAQFEMTRSAELSLYKQRQQPTSEKPSSTPGAIKNEGIQSNRTTDHYYDQLPVFYEEPTHKAQEMPYLPLTTESAKRTAERFREMNDKITVEEVQKSDDQKTAQIYVEPQSRDIEPLTPGSRRRLLHEHAVYKAEELKESERPVDVATIEAADVECLSEAASSRPSSKPTTPRLSLKFGKEKVSTREKAGTFDFGKSKISSKNEVLRLGKDVEVKVESLKLGKDDTLKIVVLPPSHSRSEQPVELPYKLKKSGKNYEVSFKPNEVGTHRILVFVNNQYAHPNTPFAVRVYDASQILVGNIANSSLINDTVDFTVDAAKAGFGNLEIAIKDSDGIIIPSHVSQQEPNAAKFLVTFNPSTLGTHTVNITFNKEIIQGSPFEVEVVESQEALLAASLKQPKSPKTEKKKEKRESKKDKEGKIKARSPSSGITSPIQKQSINGKREEKHTMIGKFPSLSRVDVPVALKIVASPQDRVEPIVNDPDKERIKVDISDEPENVKSIKFVPKRVGDYEVQVFVGDTEINGSPFTVRAYDPTKIEVSDIPDGIVNKETHFVVDASSAGVGNLEVAVNDGKIPSMAHGLGQHKYDISFVPQENIDHTISIRFNDEPVPGSPFLCRVGADEPTASGPGLERVMIGQPVSFWITIPEGTSAQTGKASMPKVQITDPRGELVIPQINTMPDDPTRFSVRYTPKEVGNHQIIIKHEGQPIPGSPFVSKAFDASSVKLSLVEQATVGNPCTFAIDAAKAGAGNMEIIVSVNSRNVPNYVQPEGQAKFKVSFTPQEAAEHLISVKFNGISIPGSPMRCFPNVSQVDNKSSSPPAYNDIVKGGEVSLQKRDENASEEEGAEELRLVGDLSVAEVDVVKRFSIDMPRGNVDCDVVVIDPHGKALTVSRTQQIEGGFDISFRPTQPGHHTIDIRINGHSLAICPIICECVRSPALNSENAKKATKRDFETSDYGAGTSMLELRSFSDKVLVEHVVSFEIEAHRGDLLDREQFLASVTDPDGEQVPVSLIRSTPKVLRGEWQPTKEGRHILHMEFGGRKVCGSPLSVDVLDLSAVRVIGLKDDLVGVQQSFNLDWSKSGGSVADVVISHENGEQVKCLMKAVKRGFSVCSFTPKSPGLYLLRISIDGMELPECPYECMINDESSIRVHGDALYRAECGKISRFEVSMGHSAKRAADLDVFITDPNKSPLPVRCYKQYDENYCVEFTPEKIGTHLIEVILDNVTVVSSPFKCEVVDPRKVKITGLEQPLTLKQIATILVDRKNAGSGKMVFEIFDPQGHSLKLNHGLTASGEDSFSFTPIKLGVHRSNFKLAGFNIPGSPHSVLVEEYKHPAVYGSAIEYAVENGQQASIIFDPNKQTGGLMVEVRGPTNESVRHSTNKRPDGTTEISFRPTSVGLYNVNIEFNNKPLHGSPYRVEVVDPTRVLVNDTDFRNDGIWPIILGRRNVVDIDAIAAGPARLRVEIRNSEGELVDRECEAQVREIGYGKHELQFLPKRPGKYKIYLYCNELVVPFAYPLLAIAEESSPIAGTLPKKSPGREKTTTTSQINGEVYNEHQEAQSVVILRGDGLQEAVVNRPAEFVIDCSELPVDAVGKLRATLIGDKADIPVRITALRNQVFKCVYTPILAGPYQLSVLMDGKHVHGSPTTVHAYSNTSPSDLIEVDTRSLKYCVIGSDIETIIDTRKAGPGQLSAQCSGPTTLEYCELHDNRDGTYRLRISPKEIGKHSLAIKYSNDHVKGSPFVVNVSNHPDPSKVRVYGPGIEHGILHSFKSNFMVETKGAGTAQLVVRVRGPKGAFNVEMEKDKMHEGIIHCKYDPREPGDYQVEVLWHGQHVPGSPFFVLIVDTEEELKRFLSGAVPSLPPPSPFVPPGWMGPPGPPFGPPGAPFAGPPLPIAPHLRTQGRVRHQF